MQRFSTVVVGGGASGIVAAISAARRGISVVLCEKMPQLGKKILASGNGRCNLLNDRLDESHYNEAAQPLARSIFSKFGKSAIKNFFNDLGLATYSENGRIFPVTNQSSSVLKILESELKRLSIPLELGFDISAISYGKDEFALTSKSGMKICAKDVVIACGGKTYPSFGADGSAYKLAKHFGHTIVEPVPVAVPLVTKDALCHGLQGQKISATARCIIDGKACVEKRGDLLFTKYGLSGTAILDASEEASIALNRHKKRHVTILIDMVPFMTQAALATELARRIKSGAAPEDMVAGILPNKFGPALKDLLKTGKPESIAGWLKEKQFAVTGTRGWNEADFTAGGVATNEISETSLESKIRSGLYFAGEILNVNGERGGYNLAWAWASGFIAGERAKTCAG